MLNGKGAFLCEVLSRITQEKGISMTLQAHGIKTDEARQKKGGTL